MNEETLVGSLDDKLENGEADTLIETPCKVKAKEVVDDSADKLLVVVPESLRKPGQNKGSMLSPTDRKKKSLRHQAITCKSKSETPIERLVKAKAETLLYNTDAGRDTKEKDG